MPGLPPSALAVLDTATERFEEKPMMGVTVSKLSLPAVRLAMQKAARAAGPGQSPAAIYSPPHGDALVVLRAEDLAAVLSGGARPHDGG